jgi:DNA polymerase-3 subunit gamma/tau
MSYQVIARKWRPQRFDDVVGQQAVTRTLRNALVSKRLAHAFVFAGPRGVGKTTTARILARALNCVNGPTPDPCGACDACAEIAEGRDIDVLEIDAATHTGIDNVREVIISGLGILPVRDRYKVFIIDEVHQLSAQSFNALLKSIEEPPPHVVFMMATTELEKIPETVLSRSQVYEFRTIGTRLIAEQLRRIVNKEGIAVPEEALQLIARDADGSMRDSQSKLDQVIAFTGTTVTIEDVATVLGLVGRDLLLDTMQAVADEDAPAAFALAARAVELGYDLRLVCRELSRVVRDLLVLSVDASRIDDPEIAGEGERDRLASLVRRFSREDLLRAFDLLTKAESDIRGAAQPRYHLEIGLLRWIYLRKLTPIEDLIAGTPATGSGAPARAPQRQPSSSSAATGGTSRTSQPMQTTESVAAAAPPIVPPSDVRTSSAVPSGTPSHAGSGLTTTSVTRSDVPSGKRSDLGSGSATLSDVASGKPSDVGSGFSRTADDFKDRFLAEVKKSSQVLYNTVVVQAQRMDATDTRVVLHFTPAQKVAATFDMYRPQLEQIASRVAGRKVAVVADHGAEELRAVDPGVPAPSAGAAPADVDRKAALRDQALADAAVQALLEVFPAEIRDVEEM